MYTLLLYIAINAVRRTRGLTALNNNGQYLHCIHYIHYIYTLYIIYIIYTLYTLYIHYIHYIYIIYIYIIYIFGDRLAYLDKFKTCARTRPIGQQKLDQKFFIKEHTKPIFKHNNILAIQNLYTYHCYLELYKIMKFRAPISLHEGYTCSSRKPCLLICQADPPDNHNTRSTKIFNVLTPKFRMTDFTTSVMCLRGKLKHALLTNQHNHALLDWTVKDFDCTNVIVQKL